MASNLTSEISGEQFIWGKLIKAGRDVKGYTIVGQTPGLSEDLCSTVLSRAKIGPLADASSFTRAWGLFAISDDLLVLANYQRSPEPEPNRTYFIQTRYLIVPIRDYQRLGANFRYIVRSMLRDGLSQIPLFEESVELPSFRVNLILSLEDEIKTIEHVRHVIEHTSKPGKFDFFLDILRAAVGPHPMAIYDVPPIPNFDLELLEALILFLPLQARRYMTFVTDSTDADDSPVKIKLNPGGKKRSEQHIVVRWRDGVVAPQSLLTQIAGRYIDWLAREFRQGVQLQDLLPAINGFQITDRFEERRIHLTLERMIAPHEASVLRKEYEAGQRTPADICQFVDATGDVLAESHLAYFGGVVVEACLYRQLDPAVADRVFAYLNRLSDELFVDTFQRRLDYESSAPKVVTFLCEHALQFGSDKDTAIRRLLPLLSPGLRNLHANPELAGYLLRTFFRWGLRPGLFRRCIENETVRVVLSTGLPRTWNALSSILGSTAPTANSIATSYNELGENKYLDLYVSIFNYALTSDVFVLLDRRAFEALIAAIQNANRTENITMDGEVRDLVANLSAKIASIIRLYTDNLLTIGELATLLSDERLLSTCFREARKIYSREQDVAQLASAYVDIIAKYRNPKQIALILSAAVSGAELERAFAFSICTQILSRMGWTEDSRPIVDLLSKQFSSRDLSGHQLDAANSAVRFYEAQAEQRDRQVELLLKRLLEIACAQNSSRFMLAWLTLGRRCASGILGFQVYTSELETALRHNWRPNSRHYLVGVMNHLQEPDVAVFIRVLRSTPALRQYFVDYAFARIGRLNRIARKLVSSSKNLPGNASEFAPSRYPDFKYLHKRLSPPIGFALLVYGSPLLTAVDKVRRVLHKRKHRPLKQIIPEIKALLVIEDEIRFLEDILPDLLSALSMVPLASNLRRYIQTLRQLMELTRPGDGSTSFYRDLLALHDALTS